MTTALVITGLILVAEVVGGIVANSLALLSDAAHMFSDVAALSLALFAMIMAAKRADAKRTFGNHRAEVLAAFINALTLVLVSLYIFYEAYERFLNPVEVQSGLMIGIAVIGLVANLASAWALTRDGAHKEDLNVRGAFLHIIGDALGSVGAVGAGLLMLFTGWYYADPIISVLIGVLVLLSSVRLLRETLHVLMEGTPAHLDVEQLKASMLKVHGVRQVHDIHVWMISSGFIAMSGHAVIEPGADSQATLRKLEKMLRDNYELKHTTIQIETENMHPDDDICTHS